MKKRRENEKQITGIVQYIKLIHNWHSN